MKKMSLFVATLMLLFVSCSRDAEQNAELGVPAKLELRLGVASKTIGTIPTEVMDSGIKNVTVGVFEGENVDVISTGALTGGKITVTATVGNRSFIVVANAPSGSFAGIKTKTAFLAKSIALTQDKESMLMSSEETSTTLTAGNVPTTKDITLTRLAARIQVTSIQSDFASNGLYPDASFTLDKIFLYNAKSKTTIGTAAITTDLVHGVMADGAESVASILDKLPTEIKLSTTAYTTPSYFYTFENTVATTGDDPNATKLVLGGKFKQNDADEGTYMYYPIVVNKPQAGTTIVDKDNNPTTVVGLKRNQQYFISLKIKGIGVDSPAKFINPANLELNIKVADWSDGVFQNVNI